VPAARSYWQRAHKKLGLRRPYNLASMLIRRADADRDGGECARIYAPFVTDTVVSLEESAPDGDELSRRIAHVSISHPWLVAESNRRLAGFAYASRHRERASYRWAADVSVYVDADQRRHGVATALYRELMQRLRGQGIYVACAGITVPNQASVALHEALGFTLVGIYPRIGYKHGAWRDVGWWQLALAPQRDEAPPEPGPPV
jgi:L-amino acid N-acyltransferase YncA